ncbi:zinc finger protein 385D-like [Dendronephthya gigantea]|uniref:zinc finger protein 385D-like n=1 Tax=Dendronephthya gigantea TaxID=151771 RepID=UPI00106BA48B|nr:zinc finger protein 385D-like [Dendronephthya gigantea]
MASANASVLKNTEKINGVKRKAEMQMIYCSVCKIFLNSSSQTDAHFAGKSHKKKATGLGQDATQGELSLESESFVAKSSNINFHKCEVCQKMFNSSVQLRDHMSGKVHQQMAQSKLESRSVGTVYPGTLDPGTFTPGTILPGSDSTHTQNKTIVQNTTNELAEPVNLSTKVGKNLSDLFHCEKCNITLNSKKQLEQHNKGLRHKIIIGEAKPPGVNGEKWENVRFSKISNAILGINKDTSTGSGGGMNLREFHCEKCDITVNSQTQLDQHLESNKHKMRGTQLPHSEQKRRKQITVTEQVGRNTPKWKSEGPMPLSNNFLHSNTCIPPGGGAPVYILPSVPDPYRTTDIHNWDAGTFGFNTAMF